MKKNMLIKNQLKKQIINLKKIITNKKKNKQITSNKNKKNLK